MVVDVLRESMTSVNLNFVLRWIYGASLTMISLAKYSLEELREANEEKTISK